MRCKQARLSVSAHLDRRLPSGESIDFLSHIDACLDCSIYLDELADTSLGLKKISHQHSPSSLRSGIMLAIAVEQVELGQEFLRRSKADEPYRSPEFLWGIAQGRGNAE